MAEDIGIYLSMYDKMSPTLKTISNNTKAFDKNLQDLEKQCKAYENRQSSLVGEMAELKKSLVESKQRVSEATKAWEKNKDALAQNNLKSAIQEQETLNQKIKDTESLLRQGRSAITGYADDLRKTKNADISGLTKGLVTAGIGNMISGSLGGAASAYLSSAIGEPTARMVSSVLSSAISGAAMGYALGPAGMAIGGALGAASGLLSGGTQIFAAEDDALKTYVQEQVQAGKEQRATELTSGSTIAGGRESTRMAFNKLLGGAETAGEYLKEVQRLAVDTNYTYDEITGYTKKLLNSFQSGTVLDILEELSDATAGLSLNSADVDMFVAGLNRMTTTGKATREYLNYFDDRGLDTSAALSAYLGKDKSAISGLVTGGKVSGQQAVEAIREYIRTQYGGLSVDLASTYDAMVDNLGDTMDNINAALGDAYNQSSKKGIGEDLEAYGGALGEAMEAMNGIIGEGKGIAQNLDRQYEREAMSALVLGEQTTVYGAKEAADLQDMHEKYTSLVEQYQTATDEDKAVLAAQIEGLKSTAVSMAESAYNASDVAVGIKDVGLDLIEAIRDNTAALGIDAYGKAYQEEQEQSKGIAAAENNQFARATGLADAAGVDYMAYRQAANAGLIAGDPHLLSLGSSHAFGLDRVPRDNFPALLHEGERVLTASQARTADQGFGSVLVDKLADTLVIREESDIEKIAAALARKLQRSSGLAVPV